MFNSVAAARVLRGYLPELGAVLTVLLTLYEYSYDVIRRYRYLIDVL